MTGLRALAGDIVGPEAGAIVYERRFERAALAVPIEEWTSTAGWVSGIDRPGSAGIYAYHPPVAALFTSAKRLMRKIARTHGFEEHIFPRHYAMENLRRFGWLDDRDLARELMAIRPLQPSDERGNALSLGDPLQCLGFYTTLVEVQRRAGGCLPASLFAGGPFSVYEDQGGWTLRNETQHRLDQGWSTSFEFAGAEFVFAGSADQVGGVRWNVLCAVTELLTELGITHRVVSARPCFHSDAGPAVPTSGVRVYDVPTLDIEVFIPSYEGARDPWVELGGGDIAGDVLTSAFGLRLDTGEPLLSGCQGLGWQRFALAVLSQLGTDPARWPEVLRAEYGETTPRSRISEFLRET